MAAAPERFSSHTAPELLGGLLEIARLEGRDFDEALQDAIRDYVAKRNKNGVQPEAMVHFRASLERNRLLYELLAQ